MSDWQPIETAPKDGRSVMTFAPDAKEPMDVSLFIEDADIPGSGEGTWRDDGRDPTHWQPLPPPPTLPPNP